MSVTSTSPPAPWLLLVFSLPAKSASQRAEVWRKLKRYGMLALRSSGSVLPHSAINQERMEWRATAIRTYERQASVVQAEGFDDLPAEQPQEGGIHESALHNHLLGESPHVTYMHIVGHGDAVQMAKAIHDAVALTKTPGPDAAPAAQPTVEVGFDQKPVEQILGQHREGQRWSASRSECRGWRQLPIRV